MSGLEEGFSDLYFALGAETPEEQEYVKESFTELSYDLWEDIENSLSVESSKSGYKEKLASMLIEEGDKFAFLLAEEQARYVGESLKNDEDVLDGFYDRSIEDRFDYVRRIWEICKQHPTLAPEEVADIVDFEDRSE